MMDVPLTSPSCIYSDNMPVIHNTQIPESTLKKKKKNKKNSICYHVVWESVEIGHSLTYHIPTNLNIAVILMKKLFGQKNRCLV